MTGFKKITVTFLVAALALQSSGWALSAPAPASAKAFSFSVSPAVAIVDDIYHNPRGTRSVLIIQDPDAGVARQQNIARALDRVLTTENINQVFVEGGAGELSLSALKGKTETIRRGQVAKDYLKNGQIQGAEYLSLVAPYDVSVVGLEDPKLYDQAVSAFLSLHRERKEVLAVLTRLESAIGVLKASLYNATLAEFDTDRERYIRSGRQSLASYADFLIRTAAAYDLPLTDFPTLTFLKDLRRKERRIDFEKADEERLSALTALRADDRAELAPYSAHHYRPSRMNFSEKDPRPAFFLDFAARIGNFKEYPELEKYTAYLRSYSLIEKTDLARETILLEESLYANLTSGESERQLSKYAEDLRLYREFISLRLTPVELEAHNTRFDNMDPAKISHYVARTSARHRLRYVNHVPDMRPQITGLTENARAFNVANTKREAALGANLLDRMKRQNSRRSVLVTSGRRTEGLRRYLRARGVSYLVLTPRSSRISSYPHYISSLETQSPAFETAEEIRSAGVGDHWMPRPLPVRPLRAQLPHDILRDKKAVLWNLQKDLGLRSSDNLRSMLVSINKPAMAALQKRTHAKPRMFWLQEELTRVERVTPAPGIDASKYSPPIEIEKAPSFEAIAAIEDRFDLENYKAFKSFSAPKMEMKPESARLQYDVLEKKLRHYEKRLKANSYRDEKSRLDVYEKMPQKGATFLFQAFTGFLHPALTRIAFSANFLDKEKTLEFRPEATGLHRIVHFMRNNVTRGGMPLSYHAPEGYWGKSKQVMDDVDANLERILIKYGVSIYDAALWQIVLGVKGGEEEIKIADKYTQRLLSGESGALSNIKAYGAYFRYGEKKVSMNKDHAYFFRIIADEYLQEDPLEKRQVLEGFPNFARLHHEDWKPITGEQAWAAIIGPLQLAYEKYAGDIPVEAPELKLALNMFPALEAMQSEIGAIYHAPLGTHGKDPHDISNENNFSVYASLKMLREALKGRDPDIEKRIDKMMVRMEHYFKNYAFDTGRKVFYQGGFYVEEGFFPTKIYAVDCQTWALVVLGPEWVDEQFGDGASMSIWRNVKYRAGYFEADGLLSGVGFTDGHGLLSVEWTGGAILATKMLAQKYKDSHPLWAREAGVDTVSMRRGLESHKTRLKDGSEAYYYANRRTFIPFGWWANPLPSLASTTWVFLIDLGYNPFVLGGGPEFRRADSLVPLVYSAKANKQAAGRTRAEVRATPPTAAVERPGIPIILPIPVIEPKPHLFISPNTRLFQNQIEEENFSKGDRRRPLRADDAWWFLLGIFFLLLSAGTFIHFLRQLSRRK